jgi:hypothetical protein
MGAKKQEQAILLFPSACRMAGSSRLAGVFSIPPTLPIISFWSDLPGFTRIWCGFPAFGGAWHPKERRKKDEGRRSNTSCWGVSPPAIFYDILQ